MRLTPGQQLSPYTTVIKVGKTAGHIFFKHLAFCSKKLKFTTKVVRQMASCSGSVVM